MTSQQKALFLESKLGQLVVKDADVPQVAEGELLVKVEAVALNPIDWQIQTFGILVEKYPAIIGSDGAGTVVGVGKGVISYAVGDRVAFQGAIDAVQKSINGTFAQYVKTAAKFAVKVPSSTSFDAAASIPCCFPTAACVLYNEDQSAQSVRLLPPWKDGGRGKYAGNPALVLGGSSSVGQYAIQLARLSGFSPIITTASLYNVDYLNTLGVTHVIDRNLSAEELQAEAAKLVPNGFSLVFDAVSLPETQPVGYALTASEGDLVVVLPAGNLGGDDEQKKKVHMARGLFSIPTNHEVGARLIENLPQWLESGDIKPNRTELLPGGLSGIVKGLERMKNKQVSGVKLVARPHETP